MRYGTTMGGSPDKNATRAMSAQRSIGWSGTVLAENGSPLADWDTADLLSYQTQHKMPAHPLASAGYLSVGCSPCTTPVVAGEEPRAGRWRQHEKLECGLHRPADVIVATG